MIENEVFKRYNPNYSKLKEYGFEFNNDEYLYKRKIYDDNFLVEIKITNDEVIGKIFDLDSEFEYTAYRVDSNGEFAGMIRNLYCSLLLEIRDKCFDSKMFVSNQACRISDRIFQVYGDLPFYEWDSTPNTGVFKHAITKKWYGIIMNIKRYKLSNGDDLVDVLNVKLDADKIKELLNLNGFYPAYHMNKKYWISIILDETISDDDIMLLINESYLYASNKKAREDDCCVG